MARAPVPIATVDENRDSCARKEYVDDHVEVGRPAYGAKTKAKPVKCGSYLQLWA